MEAWFGPRCLHDCQEEGSEDCAIGLLEVKTGHIRGVGKARAHIGVKLVGGS